MKRFIFGTSLLVCLFSLSGCMIKPSNVVKHNEEEIKEESSVRPKSKMDGDAFVTGDGLKIEYGKVYLTPSYDDKKIMVIDVKLTNTSKEDLELESIYDYTEAYQKEKGMKQKLRKDFPDSDSKYRKSYEELEESEIMPGKTVDGKVFYELKNNAPVYIRLMTKVYDGDVVGEKEFKVPDEKEMEKIQDDNFDEKNYDEEDLEDLFEEDL